MRCAILVFDVRLSGLVKLYVMAEVECVPGHRRLRLPWRGDVEQSWLMLAATLRALGQHGERHCKSAYLAGSDRILCMYYLRSQLAPARISMAS